MSGPFRFAFVFNHTDETKLWIAGVDGSRMVSFTVTPAEIVEAVETDAIKRLDAHRSAATLRGVDEMGSDHALCAVRDAARARRQAMESLRFLNLEATQ